MLDISSLLQMDFFQNFTLYAGKEGIHRTVTNVVILDYEGLYDNFCDFHEGDFVITNLLYAKDNPERIYPSFLSLMNIGVSAIAVKSVFFSSLPEEVTALAETYHVPVFFFHSIYIEDVLLNISASIKAFSDDSFYEKQIDAFLLPKSAAEEITVFLSAVYGHMPGYVCSLFLEYRETTDAFSLQRAFNTLKYRLSKLTIPWSPAIFHYKNGFLLLLSSEEIPAGKEFTEPLKTLPSLLCLDKTKFYIGVSEEALPAGQLDLCIQRSINASRHCRTLGKPMCFYHELRLDNLLFAIEESPYAMAYVRQLQESIASHEKESGKSLSKTLAAYVNHQFDMEQTAQALYQHPNTIRYRIHKLMDIWNFQTEFEFQLAAALCVYLGETGV